MQPINKTIVITGASSGFGHATALKFAKNGWSVIALARRMERLESLQQEIGESQCSIMKFDVRSKQDIEKLVIYLNTNNINVDLLVNNAGLALGLESADNADLNDWQTMVDTNISGLMAVTRALLPAMVNAKLGHIINIGSISQ